MRPHGPLPPAAESAAQAAAPDLALKIGRLTLKNPVGTASGTYGKGIDAYYVDRPDRPRDETAIDAAVDDTFPASDPPSWSGGATGAGAPEERR